MGISVSNLNLRTDNGLFRAIATPLANTAEISRGAYIVPSADPLYPSNTAYGTNANPATGGPTYISSAAVLAQNAQVNSNNISTKSNVIVNGSEMQNALNIIAQQTPGSKFATQGGIFTTNAPTTVAPEQNNTNTRQFSPTATFSNVRTESPIFETKVALTGRNSGLTGEGATNFAAVNAGLNVNFSDKGAEALQALQNSATQSILNSHNLTRRMDGMIPMAPAIISDFTSTTPSTFTTWKLFDTLTHTFNHIASGGGEGSGGGTYSNHKEPSSQEKKKKGIDFFG